MISLVSVSLIIFNVATNAVRVSDVPTILERSANISMPMNTTLSPCEGFFDGTLASLLSDSDGTNPSSVCFDDICPLCEPALVEPRVFNLFYVDFMWR